MAVSELHHKVAGVALAAAAGHGLALGGGNALLAHEMISRPTQDVALFTDQENGVEAAADGVEAALRGAGFAVERQEAADGGPADIFPDRGQGLAEWVITAPEGAQMVLQLRARGDGGRPGSGGGGRGGRQGVRAGEPGRAGGLRRHRGCWNGIARLS